MLLGSALIFPYFFHKCIVDFLSPQISFLVLLFALLGSAETTSEGKPESHLATTPQAEQSGSIVDMQGAIHDRAPGTDQLNSGKSQLS